MRGAIITNKYYTDSGMEYATERLIGEFAALGVELIHVLAPTLALDSACTAELSDTASCDFVIFWHKDVTLARAIERSGIRVFNSSSAIEICDDKAKTYAALIGANVNIPKTVIAPLMYDVSTEIDARLIDQAERLGYPVVVKEARGSQGRQVYLAADRAELIELHAKLLHVPHLFQQYVSSEHGTDIRTYVVGGKFVAACRRRNTTSFKSNVHMGGVAERFTPSHTLIAESERIASLLGLDYGSIDFLTDDTLVFVEANSNAYFGAIEKLGHNVAAAYAKHVTAAIKEQLCSKK